jgi:hypothetical protein
MSDKDSTNKSTPPPPPIKNRNVPPPDRVIIGNEKPQTIEKARLVPLPPTPPPKKSS